MILTITQTGDLVRKEDLEAVKCACGGDVKIDDVEDDCYGLEKAYLLRCQKCDGTYTAVGKK